MIVVNVQQHKVERVLLGHRGKVSSESIVAFVTSFKRLEPSSKYGSRRPKLNDLRPKKADKIDFVGWGLEDIFQAVFRYKPDVSRGLERGAATQRYVCFGHRKDPLGSGLGEYSYKAGVDLEDGSVVRCDQAIRSLQETFQDIGRSMVPSGDLQALMEIQTEFGIPTTADFGDNRIGTQFSIGKAYHSRCHADPDYFYTLLSVFWAEAQPTDVICWFIFPRYKVKVPLRNGDFLVFDPKEPHSCTNMIHEDALIFSQYTSEKTYHAHISSQCK